MSHNPSSPDWPQPAKNGYLMLPSRSRTTINCNFFGSPPSRQSTPPTGCRTTIDSHCSWPRHSIYAPVTIVLCLFRNIWSRQGISTWQWRPRPSLCPQSKFLIIFLVSLFSSTPHLDSDDDHHGAACATDARAIQGRHSSSAWPGPRHDLHPRPRHRRPPPPHQCRPLGYSQRRPHPIRPAVPPGWQCVCHCFGGEEPVG
jgi:hypothetical protein